MLIRYKKSFEKIAMGLLSFMPSEKDLKKLQNTIKSYENEDNMQLYLWKDGEDINGLIGITIHDKMITLTDISVNPSHRHQGLGREMVKCLKEEYTDYEIKATEETEAFLKKCMDCLEDTNN